MTTVVFLVHGMGRHPQGWSGAWVEALEEFYSAFGEVPLTRKPFAERIEPVEITYDDIFVELLEDWAAQGRQLSAAAAGLPDAGEAFTRLGSLLSRIDRQSFATSHAGDVALYRGLALVRERIKVHVARQIVTALETRASPLSRTLPRWMVVAHSLGTIVAHDALDAIWTLQLPPDARPSGGDLGRFDPALPGAKAELVMMVANVSRLLQSVPQAYVSTVMPGGRGSVVPNDPSRGRGCEHYVNAWHRWDPVTIAGRFAPVPPDWPDLQAMREGRFRDVEIKHIQSTNTHDFIHYMKDPRLHGLLIQRATSPALLTDRALRQAIERFDATGGLPAEQTIAVKVEVERLNVSTNALWPILLDLPGHFV